MHITLSGGLIVALGGALPALAIGLIGAKAMESLGRHEVVTFERERGWLYTNRKLKSKM